MTLQPVPFYVDNFLNFPVGEIVPTGWYDRIKAAWIPSDNGLVIKILSITSGQAAIDVDGDGLADSGTLVSNLGITNAERTTLAQQYSTGDTLWRVPVTHFTPWDCNWPYAPPADAAPPPPEPANPTLPDEDQNLCDGCFIQPQSQSLGEEIPVTGTPFDLHYQSKRLPGYAVSRTLDIPLTGVDVPPSLQSIELSVQVAGQEFKQSFTPTPNLRQTFVWDGKDGYGRPVRQARAVVSLDYQYPLTYFSGPSGFSSAFAQATGGGNAAAIGTRSSQTIRIRRQWARILKSTPILLNQAGLGGWSLNIHHSYDKRTDTLFQGDGLLDSVNSVITTVAGNGNRRFSGDGGPATAATLWHPRGVGLGPDGSLYINDSSNYRIRRVSPDGIITTVAGNGTRGFSGDSGPATAAQITGGGVGVAFSPDGSFYFADPGSHRIRQVSPDGIITTVAGSGNGGFSGDNGPASAASLNLPASIALSADKRLYIVDVLNNRIRRVSPDGIISTVAGNGNAGFSGDSGPATAASLNEPRGVALDPDGSFYIVDLGNNRIRRVDPDGIITTAAGTGTFGFNGDGGPATAAGLSNPDSIVLSQDGSLYISDALNSRIRRVSPDGTITTVAGNNTEGFNGDNGPATAASLKVPAGITLSTDGSLYIADTRNQRVRRVGGNAVVSLQNDESLVPSTDARQLFQFSRNGRHLRTLDALTGSVIHQFRYSSDGQLVEIEDTDGDITRIERDAEGKPQAIITSDGQRTILALGLDGYLSKVTDPANKTWQAEYTVDGLMTAFIDRNNNRSQYAFESDGRLKSDLNPIGGGWQLSLNITGSSRETTMTSGEGRISRFKVENLSDGTRRQTNTARDGTSTLIDFNEGVTKTTLPDGTLTHREEGPDPRFGMRSPVVERTTVTVPGGLSLQSRIQRTATLANPTDALSLTALNEISTINGKAFTQVYDANSRRWTETTAEGRTNIRDVDTKNRTMLSQISGLDASRFGYDTRGRLNNIREGLGTAARETTLTYDSQGYLHNITDAENRVVQFDYDLAGRLTRQSLPNGQVIEYGYDANGNLLSLTPPGRPRHVFNFNAVDLEDEYMPPDVADVSAPSTRYEYNRDEQFTRITRPEGQVIDYNYKVTTGQLESLSIPRGNYSFSYNATTGNVDSITAPDEGSLSFSFDGFLPTSTTWVGDIIGSVTQIFNNDFLPTQRCIDASHCVAFSFDNDSLLIQAGDLTINRRADNGLISGTVHDLVTTEQTFNGFGELETYAAQHDTQDLYQVDYTRDKLGRITQKKETLGGTTRNFAYTYDLAGRLTEVKRDEVVIETYGYDANGNRTHRDGTEIASYDQQDRLLTYGSNSYTYTANGELKTKSQGGATTTYTYDVLGNLTQVVLPGDVTLDYVIDGQNRRIGKKVNGQLTQGFLYKDQLNPVAELDGNNQVISRFVYGDKPNVPAYMIKIDPNAGTEATFRIIADHLGSPRLVINTENGVVAQKMDYDAWGKVVLDTNPGFQPFGFGGGLYDSQTKLGRFGARDYDTETGRWTSKDPIRFDGRDSNLYGYVLSDPINFVDPNGESIAQVIAAIAIAITATKVYDAVSSYKEARDASQRAREANVRRQDAFRRLLNGESVKDLDVIEQQFSDDVKDLAQKSGEFGINAKDLEFNLLNRLPKLAPKYCP